jgi:nitrous oxidase accessory protein NosD
MRRIAFGSTMAASLVLAARFAAAATYLVPPGPGTPIQDAIDAAAPGDTIRLIAEVYFEHITISKPLKLRGAGSVSTQSDITLLNGECATGPVITVAADDVQIRDLAIFGDIEGGIDVQGRARVKLKRLFVASNCNAVTVAAVNIVQSTHVLVDRVWAAGATAYPINAAGIRVADTPQNGRIRVRGSIAGHYDVGIHLENNGILSAYVSSNDVNFNHRGIVVETTSRASVTRNRLVDNVDNGIQVTALSSGNSIIANTISGSTTDVSDAGASNCWRNNTFTTGSVPTCP